MNKYSDFSKVGEYLRDREKERTCLTKIPFDSKEEAEKHKGQFAYQCPYCNSWHRTGTVSKILAKVRKLNAGRKKKA